MPLPGLLTVNAYTGDPADARSPLDATRARRFALGVKASGYQPTLAPEAPADLTVWPSPEVGWTLVLPTVPGWSNAQLAEPTDQRQCIQDLWNERGRPAVLRYDPTWDHRHSLILKPAIEAPVALAGAPRGLAPAALPYYLLIVGGPEAVPWDIQFLLNETRAVGRLALEGKALDRYVARLRDGWAGSACDIRSPFVWAVDHGPDDITRTMCDSLARPVFAKYSGDPDLAGATMSGGRDTAATADDLRAGLGRKPGVVVTTSHGMTGPLDDPAALRRQLGWLVDSNHEAVDPSSLFEAWEPDGAVWYAHACCSAGSRSPSHFSGLFDVATSIGRILAGVAASGSAVAPLPQALLGAKQPARGFVGHVEPTFNWTLQHPDNRQFLTSSLQTFLYDNLYRGQPIGHAMRVHYERVLGLAAEHDLSRDLFNSGGAGDHETLLLYSQVAMRDIRSTVLLGDPTVALPKM